MAALAAVEAHNRAKEARPRAVKVIMEPLRLTLKPYRSVGRFHINFIRSNMKKNTDPHQSEKVGSGTSSTGKVESGSTLKEKSDQELHRQEKSDRELHRQEKSDPDPHQCDADPEKR